MIYFLSDAHLGSLAIERGWAHQKKVIDMLEMMSKDAVSIYMLGDMFDFWMEYFIHDKSKRQYSPFFRFSVPIRTVPSSVLSKISAPETEETQFAPPSVDA